MFSVGSGSAVSGGHARRSSESGVFAVASPPSATVTTAAIPTTTNFSYGSQVYMYYVLYSREHENTRMKGQRRWALNID